MLDFSNPLSINFSNPLQLGFVVGAGVVSALFLIFCVVFLVKKSYRKGGTDVVLSSFNWLFFVLFASLLALGLTNLFWNGNGFMLTEVGTDVSVTVMRVALLSYPSSSILAPIFGVIAYSSCVASGFILTAVTTLILLLCIILHGVRAKSKKAWATQSNADSAAQDTMSRRKSDKPLRTEPAVLDMELLSNEEDVTVQPTGDDNAYGLTGERFNEEFLRNLDNETTTYSQDTPNREELEELIRMMDEEDMAEDLSEAVPMAEDTIQEAQSVEEEMFEAQSVEEDVFDSEYDSAQDSVDLEKHQVLQQELWTQEEDQTFGSQAVGQPRSVFDEVRAFTEEMEQEVSYNSHAQAESEEPTIWLETPDVVADEPREAEVDADDQIDEAEEMTAEQEQAIEEFAEAEEAEEIIEAEEITEEIEEIIEIEEAEEEIEQEIEVTEEFGGVENVEEIFEQAEEVIEQFEQFEQAFEETQETASVIEEDDSETQETASETQETDTEAGVYHEATGTAGQANAATESVQQHALAVEPDPIPQTAEPIMLGNRIVLRSRPIIPAGYELPIRILSRPVVTTRTSKEQKAVQTQKTTQTKTKTQKTATGKKRTASTAKKTVSTQRRTTSKARTEAKAQEVKQTAIVPSQLIEEIAGQGKTVAIQPSSVQTAPAASAMPDTVASPASKPAKPAASRKKGKSQSAVAKLVGRKKTTTRKKSAKKSVKPEQAVVQAQVEVAVDATQTQQSQSVQASATVSRRYRVVNRSNAANAFDAYIKNRQ